MRPAVMRGGVLLLLCMLVVVPAGAQARAAAPLRKTDLIRLLTGAALSKPEIADLIRRNCLSFTPTARDHQDLLDLGADSTILAQIGVCARARTAMTAPTPRPPQRQLVNPPPPAAPAPAVPVAVAPVKRPATAAVPAPALTGFVSGTGQRGVVGRRAQLPLVFEVRDTTGRGILGLPVTLAVSNGRIVGQAERTDSAGQVRMDLVFGERAEPSIVTASVGRIVRQATGYPRAGPPTRLTIRYKGQTIDREIALDADQPTALQVTAQDEFGNTVRLSGLVAAVGDERVVKVMRITGDSLAGVVTLRPGRADRGTTNLTVQAGSLRTDLGARVVRRP